MFNIQTPYAEKCKGFFFLWPVRLIGIGHVGFHPSDRDSSSLRATIKFKIHKTLQLSGLERLIVNQGVASSSLARVAIRGRSSVWQSRGLKNLVSMVQILLSPQFGAFRQSGRCGQVVNLVNFMFRRGSNPLCTAKLSFNLDGSFFIVTFVL